MAVTRVPPAAGAAASLGETAPGNGDGTAPTVGAEAQAAPPAVNARQRTSRRNFLRIRTLPCAFLDIMKTYQGK
jgi:hypothetical protein